MTSVPPEGERFSLVYIERGALGQDSERMRRRLAALVVQTNANGLAAEITRRLGIDVPVTAWGVLWADFFREADLRDVLDAVTVTWDFLEQGVRTGRLWDRDAPHKWRREVAQIFAEENLHYEVDPRGGVHHSVDAEFARNQTTTLAGLGSPRYVNVAQNFEAAHASLSAVPPDGRNAIRSTFDATEALFRLVFPREPRLTADAARDNLRPIVQRHYDGNPPATAAASKMVDAFCDWIEACHNYRHEHGREEVLAPPLELAVQLVSAGATYIRWLLEIDAQRQQREAPDGP